MSDAADWMNGLIGPDTVKIDGAQIATPRRSVNFVGATQTDNPTEDRTDIEIPGGGSAPTGTGYTRVLAGVQVPTAVADRLVLGECTLEDFGAVGDGVTNDQVAFDAARAALAAGTYRTLLLGAKTYLVTGGAPASSGDASYVWPFGISVIGHGSGASKLKTATNAQVFLFRDPDASDRAKSTLLQGFSIEGNSTGANQNGLEFGYWGSDGSSRIRVIDVTALSMGGRGFSWVSGPTIGSGPQFIGCRAISCATGFAGYDQGNCIGCQAVSCTTVGLYIGTGNISWTGGDITGCAVAVDIIAGGNDGHGIISGAQINHNTVAVRFGALVNGYTFNGCHIYDGQIVGAANTGLVQFSNCVLDVTTYTLTGSAVRFDGCRFDMDYFVAYSPTTAADVEFRNCRHIDGTVPSFVGAAVHLAYSFPSDANQTLSAKDSRAEVLDIQAGTITATRTLTLARPPNRGQFIAVKNGTAQTVNVAWSSGTSVAVATGKTAMVGADGTNAVVFGG